MPVRGLVPAFCLLLVNAGGVQAARDTVAELLDRTVWVDIGPGRTLASLTAQERAKLKACSTATLGFQKANGRWAEISYPGIQTNSNFALAIPEKRGKEEIVRFYNGPRRIAAETVRISGDVMVEETPGFRPRILIKCDFAQNAKQPPR